MVLAVVASILVHSIILLIVPDLLNPAKNNPLPAPIVARLAEPRPVETPAPVALPAPRPLHQPAPRKVENAPQPPVARPRLALPPAPGPAPAERSTPQLDLQRTPLP